MDKSPPFGGLFCLRLEQLSAALKYGDPIQERHQCNTGNFPAALAPVSQ
jgi:hypothetical protein